MIILTGAFMLTQLSTIASSQEWFPPMQPRTLQHGLQGRLHVSPTPTPEPSGETATGEATPAAPAPAATPEPPSERPEFVGTDSCLECHKESNHKYLQTAMGRRFTFNPQNELEKKNCESCHGPGSWHSEDPEVKGWILSFRAASPADVRRENAACLQCHQNDKNHLYWKGSNHENRGVACTQCHVVMEDRSPRSQLAYPSEVELCGQCHQQKKSQMFRNSHMPVREGHMNCSSCHNPHGGPNDKLLRRETLNDTCYACHADKRGPFLWEHAPVPENCATCHDPHGTTREKQLKMTVPRLCQQCHIESRHPTQARNPNNAFVIGRGCVNCHQEIHGSNHPSGHGFTR